MASLRPDTSTVRSRLFNHHFELRQQGRLSKRGKCQSKRSRKDAPKKSVASLVSKYNADVPPALEREFAPLSIGDLTIDPPVILAPMAGVTNSAYRELCSSFGAPLCVSEMVTAGTLLQKTSRSERIVSFGENEFPRSVQLYGVDPQKMAAAASMLVGEVGVDHIDLNFGCPMRKVTSKGGGAAIPAHPLLLARLVEATVKGAQQASGSGKQVPVTVKMRLGISEEIPTFLESGHVSECSGAAAVTLHTRYADQLYQPPVDWRAIRQLKDTIQIPVIGNGDIYEAADALRMMRTTGAAGVMIGRASLGRPWLFSDLAAVFRGSEVPAPPVLAEVIVIATRHARALVEYFHGDETHALRNMRKMVPLYLYGFESALTLRSRWLSCTALVEWDAAISEDSYDPQENFSLIGLRHPRLKGGGKPSKQRVKLPDKWLESRDSDDLPLEGAEDAVEG